MGRGVGDPLHKCRGGEGAGPAGAGEGWRARVLAAVAPCGGSGWLAAGGGGPGTGLPGRAAARGPTWKEAESGCVQPLAAPPAGRTGSAGAEAARAGNAELAAGSGG